MYALEAAKLLTPELIGSQRGSYAPNCVALTAGVPAMQPQQRQVREPWSE